MTEANVKRIAIVQGASSAAIQEMFHDLAGRWRPMMRIAGVIAEDHGMPDRKCSAGYLRSIVTGARYSIFQDLGPDAQGCHLEGEGALAAAAAVAKDIDAGCALVLLSKFGKLEAAGRGLADAFRAAIVTDVPILTSVSPAYENAWAEFTLEQFMTLPAEIEQIECWRQATYRAPAC